MTYVRHEKYTCDRCGVVAEMTKCGSEWLTLEAKGDGTDPLDGWVDIDVTEYGDSDDRDRTINLCAGCAAVAMDAIDGVLDQ